MGIKDLLQFLEAARESHHLSDYANQTIAVDGYCVLYGGSYIDPENIIRQKSIQPMIKYFKKRIQMMIDAKIVPIVVFDGNSLPMKAKTEEKRRNLKKEIMRKAEEDEQKKSNSVYAGAVKVTHEIARSAMDELEKLNVRYIVAPYEADAQLAYLNRNGFADAVLTQDSDLLVFGCSKVLVKLSAEGNVDEFTWERVEQMDELKGWSFEMFQMMCILRGCDYLANIKGVGFKRALEFVKQNKTMKEIIEAVKRKYKDKVPVDYEENFEKAFLTFVYQRVYDPKLEKMCLLNVPKDKTMEKFLKDVGFIGKMEDSQMMKKIANGEINPKTKEPLKSFQPISAESGAQEELKDDQEEEENLISLYNRLEITMKADEADSNEE